MQDGSAIVVSPSAAAAAWDCKSFTWLDLTIEIKAEEDFVLASFDPWIVAVDYLLVAFFLCTAHLDFFGT